MRDQRELCSKAELPALVDSVVIEAALQERGGSALELDAERKTRLKEHIQYLESKVWHYQSLYHEAGRGNHLEDLKARKQWFQKIVSATVEASTTPRPSHRDIAAACRSAVQSMTGYEVKNLLVDLQAIARNKHELEDYERALADRVCDFVDRALGV